MVVRDLTVAFTRGGDTVKPIDGFSMEARAGRLVLLLGPSGCGKTTLLSCLAGILRPTSGSIDVGGTEVTSLSGSALTDYRQHSVGVVFQAFNLVPSLSALENVMVPMRLARMPRAEARSRSATLLRGVGLGDRLDHLPSMLSGGQMQRTAIARALALDPPVIVADEPTANLDHVQVETVLRIIRSLTDRGTTVVVSTHDPRLLPLADDVVDMAAPAPVPSPATSVRQLAPGEVLFTEGSTGDVLYRVDTGEIRVTRSGVDVGGFGPGDVFGEMAPLFRLPRTATATAASASTVTAFTVDEFQQRFGGEELRRLVGRFSAVAG